MKAFTAQDWKYEGWIFNLEAGRWESLAHVVPGLEHQVTNPVHSYAAADNASEGRYLREIELMEVPDPNPLDTHRRNLDKATLAR